MFYVHVTESTPWFAVSTIISLNPCSGQKINNKFEVSIFQLGVFPVLLQKRYVPSIA